MNEENTNNEQKRIDTPDNFNDIIARDIFDLRLPESSPPNFTPKRWKEQFYLKDDGTFWVYIGSAWKQISGLSILKGKGITASNTSTVINTGFKPKYIRVQCVYAWPSLEIRSSSDSSATESGGTSGILLCKVGSIYPAVKNITKILSVVNVNDEEVAAAEISSWGNDSITLSWITSSLSATYHYEIFG